MARVATVQRGAEGLDRCNQSPPVSRMRRQAGTADSAVASTAAGATAMRGVTRGPLQLCPHCSHKIDAHGTPDRSDHAPKPGDASVCFRCGGILFVQPDMTVRKPKEGELMTIMFKDPEWYAEIVTVQQQIRTWGRDSGKDAHQRHSS